MKKKKGRPKKGEEKNPPPRLTSIDWGRIAIASGAQPKLTDEPKPLVRPPADYSNTSPYGIAQDMLWNQLNDEPKAPPREF